MIGENIVFLRKRNGLTQESLSERINVSRQTIAKWERGESEPDCQSLLRMANLFNVTIDSLVGNVDESESKYGVAPKGKHFCGVIKVGENNSITIPESALKIFSLEKGSELVLLADEERGFALVPKTQIENMYSFLEK